MKQTGMKNRISTALETLEALYFLTQSLEGQASKDIADIRHNIGRLPRTAKLNMLDSIERDIQMLRDHYGAIASNLKFRKLYAEATEKKLVYFPKGWIERFLFANYSSVYPRWPYMTLHAYVPFDGVHKKRLNWVFELEANHARDATYHLTQAQNIFSKLNSGEELCRETRQSYRTAVNGCIASVFSFLEAYLNGLAFDCFISHHDVLSVPDHDLLSEWDSKQKRRRFVSFETKLFKYPRIVGKMRKLTIDLASCKPAQFIAGEGKAIRDALTHPSPYLDPESGEHEKASRILYLSHQDAEKLYIAAMQYGFEIETLLERDVAQTAPWLFNKDGQPLFTAVVPTVLKESTYMIFP